MGRRGMPGIAMLIRAHAFNGRRTMDEKDRERSVTRRSLEDTYREVFGEPRKSERAADDRRRGFEKFSLYHQSEMIYSAGTTVGR